jgi:protein-tyrosine-phosphatase
VSAFVFRVLFVCVENSARSQIGEAFARIHGSGVLEAASAGSRPSGSINSLAIAAMRERGYNLASHASKGLSEVSRERLDYLITMGCGDECPWVPAAHREDWVLPDPKGLDGEGFRRLRDEIERRVVDLIDRIKGAI